MSEARAVHRGLRTPNTRVSLARDLDSLGLGRGMTVIVHASLSRLGWVAGGPVAVIQALMDVLGPAGTLVMPSFTGEYSDPAPWCNPPVPRRWWPVIRRHMPAFDPRITPTRGMGTIAETFRAFPGVLRSRHPVSSFAAWGRHRRVVTARHPLDDDLGPGSPLGRMLELDGRVLLLGVGHGSNTTLHLAEGLLPGWPVRRAGSPMVVGGRRVWARYRQRVEYSEWFPALGRAFERTHPVRVGRVGRAGARLIPQRRLVGFAVTWLRKRGIPGRAGTR